MFLLIYIFSIQAVFASPLTEGIAEVVNEYVKDLSPSEINDKIQFHYQLLGLMDSDGDWVHYYFHTYPNGYNLFPR